MKPHSGPHFLWRGLLSTLLTISLLTAPALAQQGATATAAKASALTTAEREAAARLKVETLREVTSALAANDMQGRGTAQPGGDKAARYIADRFTKLGLKPLGDAGTYLQAIKFRSTQVAPESFIKSGDASLKLGSDFIVVPPYGSDQMDVSGGLVFVSYGITAPELKRDELPNLDVKAKTVIAIGGGRAKNVDEATWRKSANPQAVGFGLIRRGAAGLIITNVQTGDQPFLVIADYLSRRRVQLAETPEPKLPFKLPPIILVSNDGAEKLFAGSETTYAQALAKAESGEPASRDLNKPVTISVRIKREEGTGSNVVGLLEGSDPKLKEQAVVYTAHYDAYGVGADGRIYPGAADNALGVGEMIAVAEAYAKSPQRPRRSIIFLAVTGEEYGLLGAEYWIRHPTWPIEKVAANLNYDGIGTEVYGPVKRIVGFGMEHSDLGPVLEGAVVATGGAIAPDPLPEEKAFYRSDHYAFVKKGVPALMLLGGPEGDVAPWIARAKKWMTTDYHQPTDIVRPDWNWEGARTIALVGLITGMRIANAEAMPTWLTSSPFNKPRGAGAQPPPEQ